MKINVGLRRQDIQNPTWQSSELSIPQNSVYACAWPSPQVRPQQLDDFGAQVNLKGGRWQTVYLSASDFHDATGAVLLGWKSFGDLVLEGQGSLETGEDAKKQTVTLGAPWQGPAPEFRNLRWENAN